MGAYHYPRGDRQPLNLGCKVARGPHGRLSTASAARDDGFPQAHVVHSVPEHGERCLVERHTAGPYGSNCQDSPYPPRMIRCESQRSLAAHGVSDHIERLPLEIVREGCGIARDSRDVERTAQRLRHAIPAVIHEGETESRFIEGRKHGFENTPVAEPTVQHERTIGAVAVNEVSDHCRSSSERRTTGLKSHRSTGHKPPWTVDVRYV